MRKKTYKITIIIILLVLFNAFVNVNEVQAVELIPEVSLKIKGKYANVDTIICNVGETITITANADGGVNLYETGGESDDEEILEKTSGWVINGYTDQKYKFKAKKVGKANITIYARGWLKDSYASRTFEVNVIDPTQLKDETEKIEKEQEKDNNKVEKFKNAYKSIPDIDADANTISDFLKSDAANNKLQNTKTISKEVAQKWKATLESAINGAVDNKLYGEAKRTMENYINGASLDENIINLTNEYNEYINEYNNRAANRTKQIEKISAMLGGNGSRADLGYFDDVLEDIDNYKPGDISDDDASVVESKTGKVLAIITNIAMVVAVIVPAVLGVKYMLGSVEERADYKKDMIPYLVGAVLIFGISLVVKIVQQFGNTINSL